MKSFPGNYHNAESIEYQIPDGVSNILFHYFMAQNPYTLERLKSQYEAGHREDQKELIKTIDAVLAQKAN